MSDIEFYEAWCEYNTDNLPISFAEFCYQQGREDAMELLSGTSVAYSFLNDEKHKAYLQGREDAIDEYNDAIKSHLRKLSTKFVSDKDFAFIAEQLKGEKA